MSGGSRAGASASSSLPTRTVVGYGVVAGPFEMLKAPALAIVPALYTKDFGLALTSVSLALLLLRLSDGATDFLVGVLSDRTRSRWGARKPWILASVLLAVPAAYFLYVPGDNPSIWQFATCYFFFYLAWTMFEIPYTAWSAELTHSYEDRSRLALSRGVWTNVGLILLSVVPLLPFLPSTEMTFDTLHVMFWIIAVTYPAGVLYAVTRIPVGTTAAATAQLSLGDTLRAVRGNRPLLIFLAVAFLSDLGLGSMGALFFLFFDTYLGIGASFSIIFLTAIVVATASLKPWEMLVRHGSKRRLLVVGLAGAVIHGLLVMVLDPGPYILPAFIVYMALYYVLLVGRDVALYSMIGDIVDYDTLKTGGNRAGQFSSAWMVLRKIAYAVAPALAFFVAGVAGYDPGAEQHDALAIFGLKAAVGYLPALLMLGATLLALRFPITPERHRAIRRRLQQRAERAGDLSHESPEGPGVLAR
jgi:Na+/melibiose symporter-like transporter